jgi:endonuclease-3 related protein
MKNPSLQAIYRKLFSAYGEQGWWPMHGSADNTKAENKAGYHPGDYSLPHTVEQRFEVIIGAILTQNTNWKNVQGVLEQLGAARLFTPDSLLALPEQELAALIRPTGYFNQKARKLHAVSRFFWESKYLFTGKAPERTALLAIWGVGPETADSILLYAFKEPIFVVDAYTRRLLIRLGWPESRSSYLEIQKFFMQSLPPETILYNEYHALIVEHAKNFCRKAPLCTDCPLKKVCLWGKTHG